MKNRMVIGTCIATAWLLSGCGVAETAGVAATQAQSAAQQAKEGEELKQKVQDDIAAIQEHAADARAAADEAN